MGSMVISLDRSSDIPISLSSLVCLEKFTISADLQFYFGSAYQTPPHVYGFSSSIPAIARLLRTALPLRQLTLDFNFYFNNNLICLPYDTEELLSPLVSLVTESSSPRINLRVRATYRPYRAKDILSSLTSCAALTRMVEKGVLVIILVMQHEA